MLVLDQTLLKEHPPFSLKYEWLLWAFRIWAKF